MAAEGDASLIRRSVVPMLSGVRPRMKSARFLLPRADRSRLPALPTPPRGPGLIPDGEVRAEFKTGWAVCPHDWGLWVEKLRPLHGHAWKELGIFDGILASKRRVRRDEGVLLQLATFWSDETNTFVFPWGEATVTLEDMAVLAGLPLTGGPVRSTLPQMAEIREDVNALRWVRHLLIDSKSKKPNCSGWVKHFLHGTPGEASSSAAAAVEARNRLEHGAFLSLWLSAFVLPSSSSGVVEEAVLPIAARLARGQCMALAPAVLASIYTDLSALKLYSTMGATIDPFKVSAPMHFLQLWAWEHFPKLRPDEIASPLMVQRTARWKNIAPGFTPEYVHAVFMSQGEFLWRPYISNSCSFLPETGGSAVHGQNIAKALLSFARCINPSELVGMDSIEQYCPHRVARQLGFDQDVPGALDRKNWDWEEAWESYDIEVDDDSALLIPRNHEPGVTVTYMKWWQPYYSAFAAAGVANAVKMEGQPTHVA